MIVAQPTVAPVEPATERAVCADDRAADAAIAELRAAGPAGLRRLLTAHAEAIAAMRSAGAGPVDAARRSRLRRAVDAVAGQRDAWASGLFWHTDLDSARDAARDAGQPILSLRLLGRLDEELSCANSRFFRSALYPDAATAALLRDRFVLHWHSVRAIPRITVDLRNGHRIERTITGNSAHYVLAPDGTLVDVLPGLYGPATFRTVLRRAGDAAREVGALAPTSRAAALRRYHRASCDAIDQRWSGLVARLGAIPQGAEAPTPEAADPVLWARVAQLHRADSALDAAGIAVVRSKLAAPRAVAANRIARTKMTVETPLLRALGAFTRSVAEDTVRNEYRLHRRLHGWLAVAADEPVDLAVFDARLYAELFLSPLDDPYLGLAPAQAYAAIRAGDGRVEAGTAIGN